MIDRKKLETKLAFLEALYAGAGTPGEREAAGSALQRIRLRLATQAVTDPAVEYKFTFNNLWSQRLFVALLRRYELKPYRYYRQRYTTVMVKVTRSFVDQTLWPEFMELDKELLSQLNEAAEELIAETVFQDRSDIAEVPGLPDQSGASG